jgi:hypothetical protein
MTQPSFNPIDMRLPGKVVVQTLDFTPAEPTTGAVVPIPSPPAAINTQPNAGERTQ